MALGSPGSSAARADTWPLAQAVESIASLGLSGKHKDTALAMRRVFEERTGAFGPEDAWFEARSRGFWDDAVTRQRFAELAQDDVPDPALPWARVLVRAHRGLFQATWTSGLWLLRDLWSGAEFVVDDIDDAMRSALLAPSGPFDARVAALQSPLHVGLLPGAIFHPEEAAAPIDKLLLVAREKKMHTHAVLDALLRMEVSLRSMSRVKASYAYREHALGAVTVSH